MIQINPKQKTILTLVAKGYMTKQVADRTGSTQRIVEQALRHLRIKYACVNTTHLIAFMVQEDVISIKP